MIALMVALISGTIAAGCGAVNQFHPADKSTVDGLIAVEGTTPDRHLYWRKITIGRASFKVPSQLKHTGPPGNEGIIEALRGEVSKDKRGGVSKDNWLYVYYAYGRRVPSDANPHPDQGTKVIINGRSGTLWVWQPDPYGLASSKLESPTMDLSVPDIGDGKTKFELHTAGWDLRLLKSDNLDALSNKALQLTARLRASQVIPFSSA